MKRALSASMIGLLLSLIAALPALSQDVSSSPSSLSFSNTYVGKYTGSVLTITNIQKSGAAIINSVSFSYPQAANSSGVAPTSLAKPGDITTRSSSSRWRRPPMTATLSSPWRTPPWSMFR